MNLNESGNYLMKSLKGKADDIVVSLDSREISQVKFSNNRVSTSQHWFFSNISLFASFKRRTFSTVIAPGKAAIDKAVVKLVNASASINENNDYAGIAKGPFKYRNPKIFDKLIADVDIADYVETGINTALENGASRVSGIFETSIESRRLFTSGGIDTSEKSSRAYFSIRSFAENGGSGHNVSAARRMADLKHEDAAMTSAETAKESMNAKRVDEGSYDILFSHLPAANLIDAVAGSASIFNVESGLSFLIGKSGKKVASDSFSLVDDATLDWGINSKAFDDEGVPCKRTSIIDKGIMKTYLHNTSTASKHGVKTTANAGIISPVPFNPIVGKGNVNKDAMIDKMKKGLIITNVWYTRFQNHTTGDFSTIPRDGIFLVKNGNVVGPVKGIRISDNLAGMLKRIDSVSKDLRPIVSWEVESPISVPEILVKSVNVSKSVE